jgi:hypothetical protein
LGLADDGGVVAGAGEAVGKYDHGPRRLGGPIPAVQFHAVGGDEGFAGISGFNRNGPGVGV